MLDIKRIRTQADEVVAGLKKRAVTFDLAAFAALDQRRKALESQCQALQAERNQASKQIGQLVRDGVSVDEARRSVADSLEKLSSRLDAVVADAKAAQQDMEQFMLAIPNVPASDVPEGGTEEDNVEIHRWGELPSFDFPVKDHVDLGRRDDLLDFDAGARLAGSRFVVMRGKLARLHRALIQFMLDLHTGSHGYTEVNVPYLANAAALTGTGQLPKFEDDLFRMAGDPGYYLIPTAEVPVTNLVRDSIVEALPLRLVCHTPCFRSEAGSYGRDTRGMIRQHQFEKVELVQMVEPGSADSALEELTRHAEVVLEQLMLPYRRVLLCGGDLGFSAAKTYDLEVWLPGQQRYREISSCSHFGDFQARRMKARYRSAETGKPAYLHTLNGSGLAVGRTLVAILENYQRADGTVAVPAVLQPYMAGVELI